MLPNTLTANIIAVLVHALRCWALKLELDLQERLERRLEDIDAKNIKLMEEISSLRVRGRDYDADRLLHKAIALAGIRTSCANWLSILGSRKTDSDAGQQDVRSGAEREVGESGSPKK